MNSAPPMVRAALAGGILWIFLGAVWRPAMTGPDWPRLMVAFGAMVSAPLGFAAIAGGIPRLAGVPWPVVVFASSLLGISLTFREGVFAGTSAVPWLVFALWLAGVGLLEAWRRRRSLADVAISLGVAQLAIGAAWALADRVGFAPLGFHPFVVTLTAAHFHFAGFSLPFIAGLLLKVWTGRGRRVLRPAVAGVIAGIPAVATGITLTQLGAPVAIECILASLFAVSALAGAVFLSVHALRMIRPHPAAGLFLLLSGLSLLAGMTLALLYALRPWLTIPSFHLPNMWKWHGTINVFGFTLCGWAGWLMLRAKGHRASDQDGGGDSSVTGSSRCG